MCEHNDIHLNCLVNYSACSQFTVQYIPNYTFYGCMSIKFMHWIKAVEVISLSQMTEVLTKRSLEYWSEHASKWQNERDANTEPLQNIIYNIAKNTKAKSKFSFIRTRHKLMMTYRIQKWIISESLRSILNEHRGKARIFDFGMPLFS